MKPYRLDDRKAAKPVLSNVDIAQWRDLIIANIKAEAEWRTLVTLTWGKKKVPNRGFVGDDAAADAIKLDRMLTFIATYAPSTTFNEITTRCTSLKDIWDIIRRWAGVRQSGSKHLTYYQLRNAYDSTGIQSPQEFYFQLRDAKEECLITAASGIKFNKAALSDDEELTACIESDVVLDWISAIGGPPLVEHIFRTFSKELESSSLADLQERIADSLPTLISETEDASQALIQRTFSKPGQNYSSRGSRPPFNKPGQNSSYSRGSRPTYRNDRPPPRQGGAFPRSPSRDNRNKGFIPCSLCKAKGRPEAQSHHIGDCWLLTYEERKAIIKATGIQSTETEDEEESYDYENANEGFQELNLGNQEPPTDSYQ